MGLLQRCFNTNTRFNIRISETHKVLSRYLQRTNKHQYGWRHLIHLPGQLQSLQSLNRSTILWSFSEGARNFVFGETNTEKDFLAKFPTGKVPAFEATDGTCLTESNAIAYYVGNDALRASESAVHSAQVIQWMQFADSDILPASCTG